VPAWETLGEDGACGQPWLLRKRGQLVMLPHRYLASCVAACSYPAYWALRRQELAVCVRSEVKIRRKPIEVGGPNKGKKT
jgi:hypothetical protein